MKDLTANQQKVLDFITGFRRKKGYSPTVREIATGFGFGVRAAYDYMLVLKKKGFVVWEEKTPRSIVVL
jgi:SOS-response transcriptional repressor LexA